MEDTRPISVGKASRPLSLRELFAAAAYLGALAVLVYLPYVLRGGFYSDDWSNAELYGRLGLWDGIVHTVETLGARPLLGVLLPVPHVVFGTSAAAQLGLGIALGAITCLAFYLVLRELGVAPLAAGAMSGLALVFPWSDSVRLWATASVNTIAVLFALGGMLVALRSLGIDGRRGVFAHAVAVALFVLSILTYEAAAGVMLLFGVFYLSRVERSRAWRLWAMDAVAIVLALAYTALTINKNVGGIGDRIADVPRFAEQAVAVLSYSFVPPGTTERSVRLLAVLLVFTLVAVALHRYRATREPVLGYWLRVAAVGAAVVVASHTILLGTYLEPISPGTGNRANLVAEYGYAVLVVALVLVAVHGLRFTGRVLAVASVVGVLLVSANYVAGTVADERDWERAADLQAPVLDALRRALPELPPESTVLTVGHRSHAAPGVPVFSITWDLNGAVSMLDQRRIRAYPIHDGVGIACRARTVLLTYPEANETVRLRYGSTYVLDVSNGRRRALGTRADCLDLLENRPPAS